MYPNGFFQLWSALPVGGWAGSILKDQGEAARSLYSHDDYIYLVGHSGQVINTVYIIAPY